MNDQKVENVRFTAWLSPAEREGLDRAAREAGTSVNYVLRMVIRSWLGLNGGNRVTTPDRPNQPTQV